MALGAEPRDLVWLVIRQGMRLTLIGGLTGAAGAIAVGRALAGLLYGVSPTDAVAFSVAIAVAVATALVACAVPARRAAVLDPVEGLRQQ